MTRSTQLMLLVPAALLALTACGRDAEDAHVKLVGVGYNPDDIGPVPEDAGGLIEYDHVDFAGGGLSLGLLGLVSTDEVGPGMTTFAPPYAAVYGLSFLFDAAVPDPLAHYGAFGTPPPAVDNCWTTYEPMAFISAGTVDVGYGLRIRSMESESEYAMGRYPEVYPPDPQDVFVYYIGVEGQVTTPMTAYAPGESDDPATMSTKVVRPANYPHGEEVRVEFPGGIPPFEAPVSSIPQTSFAVGEVPTFRLPTAPSDLMLAWDGVAYDGRGNQLESEGAHQTCVQFLANDPEGLVDCGGEQVPPSANPTFDGQIYTGPWDTSDGKVTFRWTPGENTEEKVILNIRFLEPIDAEGENFLVGKVPVDPNSEVQGFWEDDVEDGLVSGDFPQGYRDPLACEEADGDAEVDYIFNPLSLEGDGDPKQHMRGDPSSNLAEVSCLVSDDGEFDLTMDHLEDAIAYVERNGGAGGAVFFFSRTTEMALPLPAVKDREGNRRDVPDAQVQANSIKVGRLWLEDDSMTSLWAD